VLTKEGYIKFKSNDDIDKCRRKYMVFINNQKTLRNRDVSKEKNDQ
jgi:hypothetical protein